MGRRWPGSSFGAMQTTGPNGRRPPAGGWAPTRFAGACDVALDPEKDARAVHPLWIDIEDRLPHVRAAGTRTGAFAHGFDLWRFQGLKQLVHTGADLVFGARSGPLVTCACLASNLDPCFPCRITVPAGLGSKASDLVLRLLSPDLAQSCSSSVTRVQLLHMRCLQALDALQVGFRQRDVAAAVFGPEAADKNWHTDGELRAQVRHLIGRAKSLVDGGYLALAGVRPT